jgi:hypothetical protein
MKFVDKIMEEVKGTLARMEPIAGEMEELERKYKANDISAKEYQTRKKEFEDQRVAVIEKGMLELHNLGNAYRKTVESRSIIDSSMLHDDAKLLQMDMKMTSSQFEALVEKHKDNPLMAQLLQGYSNKHECLYAGFIPTPESRISAFDTFVGYARDAIRTPDTMHAALFLDGYCTPIHCNEAE